MCRNSIQIPQVRLDQNYPSVDFVNFQGPLGVATQPLPINACIILTGLLYLISNVLINLIN